MDETVREPASLVPRKEALETSTRLLIAGHVVGLVCSFASTILVVRLLSYETYASFVLTLAVMVTAMLSVQWGYATILPRYLGQTPEHGRLLCRRALIIQVPIALLLLGVGLIIITFLETGIFGVMEAGILGIGLAALGLRKSLDSTFRTIGYTSREAVLIIIERAGTLLALLILGIVQNDATLTVCIGISFGPVFALAVSVFWYFDLRLNDPVSISPSAKQLFSEGLPYVLIVAIVPLIGDMDKFVLAFLDLDSELPIYDVAWRLQMAGATLVIAIQGTLLTAIARDLHSPKQLHNIRILSSRSTSRIVALGLAVGPVAGIVLVPIMFGQEYSSAADVLILLIAAWSVCMMTSPLLVGVRAGCRGRDLQLALIVGIFADGLVTYLLAERLGASSAGFGTIAMFWISGFLCLQPLRQHGLSNLFSMMDMMISLIATIGMCVIFYMRVIENNSSLMLVLAFSFSTSLCVLAFNKVAHQSHSQIDISFTQTDDGAFDHSLTDSMSDITR